MFLYYITPATTKQVEELRRQGENLLKYKRNSRRTLRALQNAYLRVRGERDNKDIRLRAAKLEIDKLRLDNKNLRAALFPATDISTGTRG